MSGTDQVSAALPFVIPSEAEGLRFDGPFLAMFPARADTRLSLHTANLLIFSIYTGCSLEMGRLAWRGHTCNQQRFFIDQVFHF